MSYKSVFSSEKDVALAVKEIKHKASEIVNPALVVYFASTAYGVNEISRLMADAFPTAQTVGCTSAGEMVTGKMMSDSIVAMICGKDSIPELKVEVVENIKEDKKSVIKAFKNFDDYFRMPVSQLSPSEYVGMVLIDKQSKCEEFVNDQIGNLTNVIFVGGSAAAKHIADDTFLFANGKSYTNATVLVLMKPANGFAFLKTQSLSLTDKKLIPTKVNEATRTVLEFNNRPAAEAYADIIGATVGGLSDYFVSNPLALVFDEKNFFVRDPQCVLDNGAMDFFCSVKEGVELTVLQARDILPDTKRDLEAAFSENKDLKAIIEFNCVSRMFELLEKGQGNEYAALFKSIPTVSFGTFGESYIGHMNQTSTMLLLK